MPSILFLHHQGLYNVSLDHQCKHQLPAFLGTSDDIGHYRAKKIPDNFHTLHNEVKNTVLCDTFALKLKNELISLK